MKKKFNHIRQHRTTDQHADRPNVFLFFAHPQFLKTILWLTRIWHIWFCPTHKPTLLQNQKSQIFPRSILAMCILTMLFPIDSYGQIKPPQPPQFPNQQQQQQTPTQNHPMGATANDIMEQTYRNAEQQMGAYMNRPWLTPEQNKKAAQQYQIQQLQKQSGYGNPTAENNFNQMTPQAKLEKEMTELLRENQSINSITNEKDYYNSDYFKNDLSGYIKAKQVIQEMLNGKQNLSIKDAFYFSEAAFGDLHLTYNEYNKTITDNVNFILQWLKENNYNQKDPEALHFGIQKFMADTLYINVEGKRKGHIPYYYDYIDVLSGKDRRNYFVTKTIATGSGQCHTFPITYLILAEALGIEANLAYNPQHSFIRFKNNQGAVINYETTVDKFLPNSFYIETLPVMAEAQRNSLYVTELNKKQVVASVLFDLAVNFIKEHWLHDKSFIVDCIKTAEPYFPRQGFINTANNYLHKRLYADEFNSKIQEKKIKDFNEIERYPDVLQAYKNYYGYMESVSKLGIQDFPEAEYLRMLSYYDHKGKIQTAQKINAKTKKSLFLN
ncbi:MAG: hypothetical protein QY303_05020 [Vicingaceae bacterium]|nr:MAG: hypothetical protein QY303_05020 [Vicingaceae bacterium]